ncbi:MAG: flavodoxin family protein [Deltaproteobacteria bacterium]|nr:flavodoxin family protein [Deltaproteobacteria bacterium]
MKILTINGSRRKNGNTDCLIQSILVPAVKGGAQIESIFLGDYNIDACTGCEGCSESWECVIKDDFAKIIKKLDAARAVVIASPTYWYSVTSDMKRFIDRCYSIIQFPDSRKEWIAKYQGMGKVCVTAAVCEQSDASMMGNTLSLLTDFSKDIGLDVVESVAGLGFFEAGRIKDDHEFLQTAETAGQKLYDRLK